MQKRAGTYQNTSSKFGQNFSQGKANKLRLDKNKNQSNLAITSIGVAAIASPIDKYAVEVWGLSEIHKPIEDVYNDLLPAYLNYLQLVGKKSKIIAGFNDAKNINIIFDHLLEIFQKEYLYAHLNILFDEQSQQYKMCVSGYYHGSGNCVYAIPLYAIKLFEKNNYPLFNAICDLMHWLYSVIGFQHWDNCDFMAFITESLRCQLDHFESEEEMLHIEEICSIYENRKSDANKMLYDITKCRTVSLNRLLKNLQKTSCKKHQKNIQLWGIEGVKLLMETGAKNLNNFQNDDEFKDYNEDGNPLGVADCFVFNWFPNDVFLNYYLECLGHHSNEFSSHSACSFLIIDKKTNTVYKHEDWYIRFIDWLNKGICMLHYYAEKNGYKNPMD